MNDYYDVCSIVMDYFINKIYSNLVENLNLYFVQTQMFRTKLKYHELQLTDALVLNKSFFYRKKKIEIAFFDRNKINFDFNATTS